jgi:thioredoxin-like negative regulator of GroEL
MPIDRLETLTSILAANPADTFARYGLAMEYVKTGDYESAATEFQTLLTASPDHVAACFQAGQTLEKLGRPEEAIQMYTQGIAAATRQGNTHARDQMQTALDQCR